MNISKKALNYPSSQRFGFANDAVIGLPLRLLIMVVIAAVSLVAITGFIIVSGPKLDRIEYGAINIAGQELDKVICDDLLTKSTEKHPVGSRLYRGSPRVNDSGSVAADPNYDTHLKIYVYDIDGEPLAGVVVTAEGTGVHDAGKTNGDGYVEISLEGCFLQPGEDVDTITITAEYSGTLGMQEKSTVVPVTY